MSIVTESMFMQALTVSAQQRSKQVANIAWSATPLTKILRENGNIRPKAATGPLYQWPVEYDKLSATWIRGYDYIPVQVKEIINSAHMPWANVVSLFSLTGEELAYNRSEAEIIDLMSRMLGSAENGIAESIEAGSYGNGTAFAGREMIGLGAAVPTVPGTGIYAGINRANVPRWRTSYYDVSNGDVPGYTTWDTASALPIISTIARNRSRGRQYPDLWIVSGDAWQPVESSFVAHQRIVSDRAQRLGLPGYSYNTSVGPVDLVPAVGIGAVGPSDTLFGIDTSSFEIREFEGRNFRPFHPGSGMRTINQDAIAQGILWSGQMIMTNPLSNVRVDVSV